MQPERGCAMSHESAHISHGIPRSYDKWKKVEEERLYKCFIVWLAIKWFHCPRWLLSRFCERYCQLYFNVEYVHL